MARIHVEKVTKSLGGRKILDGVDLSAGPGDIVALIGPSGCGKTTLLRSILGEVRPDTGRIIIDGQDVTQMRVEKRRVSIVYQDYALFPHMTVEQNVGYGLRIRRWPRAKQQRRIDELLAMVHLEDQRDKYPRNLSGGQQQRVAIARALAVEPRILLLDEAFTALDTVTRTELIAQVRDIIKRLKVTTIMVTHDQEEAFLFAKNVIVLNEGKVVVAGRPETVMKHKHSFVQDFVKMVLFQRATVQKDTSGNRYVQIEGGAKIPLAITGVREGDEVHVMVKKGPERESVEVWPIESV
ncbi:MAG TPA: ABC transporter ATP-binding protein [Candidatus Thermoplasmatota archaeon]|nr:ABC transporter ATP-binding protein [Candidatus Thermoplasmatota archaeon]